MTPFKYIEERTAWKFFLEIDLNVSFLRSSHFQSTHPNGVPCFGT